MVNDKTSFMAVWKAINEVLKDKGVEPITFGDARRYFEVAKEYDREDRQRIFRKKLGDLAKSA